MSCRTRWRPRCLSCQLRTPRRLCPLWYLVPCLMGNVSVPGYPLPTEAMKRASSPRTSRRFTGELSCWAQGQRRFFPYWSKTLGLAGYLKVQLMWGQVHLLWCLAYSYWVDFGSSIYIKNETRLLWLRCFCFRTLRTFQTFGYEVSSANRQDLLLDRR